MEKIKLYADLTFLTNFAMDFFILWATTKLARVEIKYSRIFLASVLGGCYAVGYLWQEMALWYSFPVKVLLSCLLVIVGLWPRGWSELKLTLVYFYGISFIAAGATIAASYFFVNNLNIPNYSYLWLLAGVFCILFIGIQGDKFLQKQIISKLLKYKVHIRFGDNTCGGDGFLDTGNGLRDPLTNKPVVVAEYNLLKQLFPVDFRNIMESNTDEADMLDELAQTTWANRLRLIPFSSIGQKNGLLIGVRADELTVEMGNNQLLHKNMVIGIYRHNLCSDGNYHMLIPSEILLKG